MKKIKPLVIFVIMAIALLGLNVSAASEYCDYFVDPAGDGAAAGKTLADAAYFTWQTNESGEIIVTITPFNNNNALFRGGGMIGVLTMNGGEGYFTRQVSPDFTRMVFTPALGVTIPAEATISYFGYVEMQTTGYGNLYPSLTFNYTYGTNCDDAIIVSTEKDEIVFTPEEGIQTFMLSGQNLTGDITINTPKGIEVTPKTISPVDGVIENNIIRVKWVGGTNGGSISITGGGLAAPRLVAIASHGLSEYCNKIIDHEWSIYLSIDLSDDKTQMKFSIFPMYEDDGITKWMSNSIPSELILVDDQFANPVRAMNPEQTEITLTFDEPLQVGSVVTFGRPLVWTTKNKYGVEEANCFIDGAQYYTVGSTCECVYSTVSPTVVSVGEATNITETGAEVTIEVSDGDYPTAKIKFIEENGKVNDILLNKTNDDLYLLNGLSAGTSYSFIVTAIDTEENESDAYSTALSFTTFSYPTVASVGPATNITQTSTEVTVEVIDGYYPVEKILFVEEDGKVNDILLNKTNDNIYLLNGLSAGTSYSFMVIAVDAEGNESDAFATLLSFETDNLVSVEEVQATKMLLVQYDQIIKIQSDNTVTNVQLFDAKGQFISVLKNTDIINTSMLNAGIYMLKIQDATNTVDTFKIIVK